ncbi:MAG: hypothetical protein LBQ05_00765 [Christensenellaceae bacterium]|nr:hypothetical protein [Christensenellaceae bacterium]
MDYSTVLREATIGMFIIFLCNSTVEIKMEPKDENAVTTQCHQDMSAKRPKSI